MKNIVKIWILATVAMFMFSACSEEVGLDDGVTISGIVKHADTNTDGAFVYISYGASEATSSYDQVTISDANGNYKFEGLNAGDYYLDAVYTNSAGVEFNSPGYVVTVGGSNDQITVNFNLK